MAQPRKLDRPCKLEIRLPESVYIRFQLELFSELEGRVPLGLYSATVTELVREWLRNRGHVL